MAKKAKKAQTLLSLNFNNFRLKLLKIKTEKNEEILNVEKRKILNLRTTNKI